MQTSASTPAAGPVDVASGDPLPVLLSKTHDAILKRMYAQLEAQGFSGLRYRHECVFRYIDADGSRLTDLAERSGLTKQSVAEAVVELESRGYVERAGVTADRRVKIIKLTERGRGGQRAARKILAEIEAAWTSAMSQGEPQTLRHMLEKIVRDHEDV